MFILKLKMHKYLLLLIFLFLNGFSLVAQNNVEKIPVERRELIRKIGRQELMKTDVNNYLDKKFFDDYDSIKTKYWKSNYWFIFQSSEKQKKKLYYLFALDSSKTKLVKISDYEMGWSDFSSFWSALNFNNDKMYWDDYIMGKDNKDELCLIVLDEKNFKIQSKIKVAKSVVVEDAYMFDNKLHIIIQPQKRKLNLWHYLDFWFPRGRSSKWEYVDNGNKWLYVYDKDFNLVSKEEIKK
jgi:hypothetical protein